MVPAFAFASDLIFIISRQSELLVKLNRLLEKCLRNSKCIDTESLCVVAGEKVCSCMISEDQILKNIKIIQIELEGRVC